MLPRFGYTDPAPLSDEVLVFPAQEAAYYKTVSGPEAAKTNIVWKETNYAMPIPASEFEPNPSSGMVQTPGY